ncbi:MAG: VWA domain-containing protein [Myxococcales bacterium]|nr:VWA domain-containing protein [Myxococcales bacterium]
MQLASSPRSRMTVITLCTLAALALVAVGCGDSGAPSSADGYSSYGDGGYWGGADAGGPWGGDAGGAVPPTDPGGEKYGEWIENDWVRTTAEPKSTFGIDVDTASYTLARRDLISNNRLPVPQSVRIEEYLNYFDYNYPEVQPGVPAPFSVAMELAPSKFGAGKHLLRIALKGREIKPSERKAANLIFLIDVSGSMQASNKLPLVQSSLTKLVDALDENDTLGIVVYASNERVVLEPTAVLDKAKILHAINTLSAGGSTNGAAGIQMAYKLAEQAYKQGGINRVMLCTDGDMNVGLTGQALVDYVIEKRKNGVTLSTLGFGSGNYNDKLMQNLAENGNGNYHYIDSAAEAERVLVKKLVATLQVIAKDVKIQIDFDTTVVDKYRLLGYESRLLQNKDFTDDNKDAGEIGAGHRVTAFYEVQLRAPVRLAGEVATLRLRYKQPDGDVSSQMTHTLPITATRPSFEAASADFRFAAAVAELAEILRHSKHSSGARFDEVIKIAEDTAGNDQDRKQLVDMAKRAAALWSSK